MNFLDISFLPNPLARDLPSLFGFREKYLGYLAPLARGGHAVTMLECADFQTDTFADGIRHRIFRGRPSAFWLPVRLLWTLRSEGFALILVHGLRSPLQVLLLKICLTGLKKKPEICLMHHAEKPSAGLKGWLQKLADRLAVDAYFFASAGNAKLWVGRGIIQSEKKIREVMEISTHFRPQNRAKSREKLNLPADETLLLWVGRLHKIKDPLTVLRGFDLFLKSKNLPSGCPTAHKFYVIFQNEDLLPEVETLISKNENLQKTVVLVGKVENSELENWFSAADFFTLGSRYEGSGTALAEAMACGCVPLVSDIAAFRSITGEGKAGFLFKVGDPESFAHALAGADFGLEFRASVRRHFEENLSWEAIAVGIVGRK